MRRIALAALAAMTLLFSANIALGCSLARPPPSASVLVAESDAIYLAVAMRYATAPSSDTGANAMIQFQVLEILKGSPRYHLELEGMLSDRDDFNDQPDVPRRWLRPEGRRGSCFARTYKQGGTFLLIMRGGSPYWAALTPTNEQVTSPGDPWVAWVRDAVRNGLAAPSKDLTGTSRTSTAKPTDR